MSEPQVLPEAEPMSADGGPAGVLVLHGFTGNPSSMRGIGIGDQVRSKAAFTSA